MKASSLVL